MRTKIVCSACHKRKRKYAKGLCSQCYQQCYQQTDAYKQSQKRYQQTDACKQYRKRYRQTDAFKQSQKRYYQTVKQALKEFRAKKEKAADMT